MKISFVKEIIRNSAGDKIKFVITILLTLVSSMLTLLVPQIIGMIFDPEIGVAIVSTPHIILYGMGAVIVIYTVQGVSTYMLGDLGIDMMVNLQKYTFEHILYLPLSTISNLSAGDLSSRLTNDVGAIIVFVSNILPQLMSNTIIAMGSLIFLLWYSTKLTLVIISLIPILLIVRFPLNSKLEVLSKLNQEKLGDISEFIVQRVSKIKLIKSFIKEDSESEKGNEHFKKSGYLSRNMLLIQVLAHSLTSIILFVYIFIVFYFTYRIYIVERLQVAELVTYFIYIFILINPCMEILSILLNISEIKGSMIRLFSLLDMKKEDQFGLETDDYSSITIKKLCFKYPDNLLLNLDSIEVSINQPSFTAIVGPSGAGKSTLLSLIMKFYSGYEGSIKIGDQELSNLSTDSIRQNIAYIDQKQELFPGTIRENLLYGNNIDNEERINETLNLINAHNFIEKLPNGLDTYINESTSNLSEGQKQRLCLARALLSDPQILLFDEPTSNLDNISVSFISHLYTVLSQQKIVIVVAHQLDTIQDADQILVMSETGKLVSKGDFKYLLSNSEAFQNLYYKQIKE